MFVLGSLFFVLCCYDCVTNAQQNTKYKVLSTKFQVQSPLASLSVVAARLMASTILSSDSFAIGPLRSSSA